MQFEHLIPVAVKISVYLAEVIHTAQPHVSGYYLLVNNEVIKIHSQFETTDHSLHPGRKLTTSKVMCAYIFWGAWSQFRSLIFYFILYFILLYQTGTVLCLDFNSHQRNLKVSPLHEYIKKEAVNTAFFMLLTVLSQTPPWSHRPEKILMPRIVEH